MKGLAGLNMLGAIWLLLWAWTADGDTSTVSILDHTMDGPSSSQKPTYTALNTTITDIVNVSSMAEDTTTSSTRCLNAATMLAGSAHQPENAGGQLRSIIKLPDDVYHPQNSSSISVFDLLMDDKPNLKLLKASYAPMTNTTHSSDSESSAMEAFGGLHESHDTASPISSQSFQTLSYCGNVSAPIEIQDLSVPTQDPRTSTTPSHPASRISTTIIPRAEEVTPAPATHKSLIIGVVFGCTFGSLLIVLVAASCCSSRVRRKLWFWRRHKDQHHARGGLPRCDSPATTLGLGDGSGISNASSDTLFEAYGVRPGQYPRNVRINDRTTQRAPRDSGSYELEDLRALAGYSTGGYLSAV